MNEKIVKAIKRAGFLLVMCIGFWINYFTAFLSTMLFLVSYFTVKPILWVFKGGNTILEDFFYHIVSRCCDFDKKVQDYLD